MNRKAQGLPINFIVLAALAMLILILAAGFVIAGQGSIGSAMGPQNARTTCQGLCQQLQNTASTSDYPTSPDSYGQNSAFCTRNMSITGQGSKDCKALGVGCIVSFNDGSTLDIQNNC